MHVVSCKQPEGYSTGWTLDELNHILQENVVDGTLTTLGCVEWESEMFRGVMRARFYTFKLPKRRFHGFNPQVYIHSKSSPYLYMLHSRLYRDIQVHTGTYWYILVHTGTYWFIRLNVCFSVYKSSILCKTLQFQSLRILTTLRTTQLMFL
jgi:hypothetical protein